MMMISIRKLIYGLNLIPIIFLLVISILMEDELNSKFMAVIAVISATITYHNLKKNKNSNYYDQY